MDGEVQTPGCRRCGSPMARRSMPRHVFESLTELIFCHYDCGDCGRRFRLLRWRGAGPCRGPGTTLEPLRHVNSLNCLAEAASVSGLRGLVFPGTLEASRSFAHGLSEGQCGSRRGPTLATVEQMAFKILCLGHRNVSDHQNS
jgi:hypothetical protein